MSGDNPAPVSLMLTRTRPRAPGRGDSNAQSTTTAPFAATRVGGTTSGLVASCFSTGGFTGSAFTTGGFGASSLLTDVERQLEHHVAGHYSAAWRHAMP